MLRRHCPHDHPRASSVRFVAATRARHVRARDLRREIAAWSAAPLNTGPVLFDRGVVDAVAMAEQAGALEAPEITELLERHRYRSPVFLFPPWREIYVHDAERDHDFEHVERVHHAVRHYYERVGYRIVQVPRVPVEARTDFVLERIEE